GVRAARGRSRTARASRDLRPDRCGCLLIALFSPWANATPAAPRPSVPACAPERTVLEGATPTTSMPEGDTLHFFARSVRPRLVGEPIAWLRLRDRGEVEAVRGCPIDAVEVVGKHLLVHIGRRHTLHVHLGLRGRWRTYDAQLGPGEPIVTAST